VAGRSPNSGFPALNGTGYPQPTAMCLKPGKGVHGYLVCHHGTICPAEAPTWAGEDWINRQFDTVEARFGT
jgi:hypothetical protein